MEEERGKASPAPTDGHVAPYDCLAYECSGAASCAARGRCRARDADSIGSWALAIDTCRERKLNPFRPRPDHQQGDPPDNGGKR